MRMGISSFPPTNIAPSSYCLYSHLTLGPATYHHREPASKTLLPTLANIPKVMVRGFILFLF